MVMKNITLAIVLTAAFFPASAQNLKKQPPPAGTTRAYDPAQLELHWPGRGAVPAADHPFGISSPGYRTLPPLSPTAAGAGTVRTVTGETGLPIFFEGRTPASGSLAESRPASERAPGYWASLRPAQLNDPAAEFTVASALTDEQGNTHVRLDQQFQGIPVFGGEVIAHTEKGAFVRLNGRYYPTPRLESTLPSWTAEAAVDVVREHLGPAVKTTWSEQDLALVGGQPFRSTLVIWHPPQALDGGRLAWHVVAHPNLLRRYVYFVDAQTGAILQSYDHTCEIHPEAGKMPDQPTVAGPVVANGLDLLDINRTFGAWQDGSTIYMEDASKPMFDAGASQMPDEPVGAIVTVNALNTSPENPAQFNYQIVTSGSTNFNFKAAVSAHWNSIRSYDYYKNTFNRNSIDGVGGNIISFVNVAEDDGSSLGNAFWNGEAMWYGNGDQTFKPLARGLDVGGHEMTHGVVERTANLIYQEESGALNESFADIFGVMIDRDDWKIGEDVVQAGATPNNALRDLQNPHNGAPSNSAFWQPNHVNEMYTGAQDNGGVHINSGIPNHAFYLFASNAAVGKDKAEQVYYKALRDYLVKSSRFIDARLAVIQAANDLYGSTVAGAAGTAFDQVGITGSQSNTNALGQLSPNPGTDYVLCVTEDYVYLDLAQGNGAILGELFDQGLKSRPSITDDGRSLVFVDDASNIIGIDLEYAGGDINFEQTTLSSAAVWRNAVISKDGRFIAALTEDYDNLIYLFDLNNGASEVFHLYNPTYTPGIATGDVQYADVLEFDYSGEFLMYDAFNRLTNSAGETIEYWDISFMRYRENGVFANGLEPFINNLFNSLPEKTSIGNPTFAKNSPFVIAFDLIDEIEQDYHIFGANVETGEYDVIVPQNGDLGWPNYSRLDNNLIFQSPGLFSLDLYRQPLAPSKIQPQGNPTLFIEEHVWGVWYGNGFRSLMVDAGEPGRELFQMQVFPNPVDAVCNLSVKAPRALSARLSVYNLLGEALQVRAVELAAGSNQLQLSLETLPAGVYVVRLDGEAVNAAVQVVKGGF
jgi:Zn-dependent metalloprotease